MLAEARTALESMRQGGTGTASASASASPSPLEDRPVEGVGTASGDRVKATALPGGRLKSVELDPRMMRMSAEDLSEQVTLAVNAAFDDLRATAAERSAPEAVEISALGTRLEELQTRSHQQLEAIIQALDDAATRVGGHRRRS